MEVECGKYYVAFVKTNGDWDIVDSFEASSDEEANQYTEEFVSENYKSRLNDWYVLDASLKNINAYD